MISRLRWSLFGALALPLATLVVSCGGDPKTQDEDAGCVGDACASGSSGNGSSSGQQTSSGGSSSGNQASSSSGGSSSGESSSSSGSPPPQRYAHQPQATESFACSPAGSGPGGHNTVGKHQIWLGSGRNYIYTVPQGYDPSGATKYPVLFALHGLYADNTAFSNFVRLENHVDQQAIVVYATAEGAPGNSWKVWDTQSEFGYFADVLADLGGKLCYNPSRVFALGYSWGGYMAQRWSCQNPGLVKAAVFAASGWEGNENPDTCGQIPVLVYGRLKDPDESVDKSRWSRDQRVKTNQCEVTAGAPPPALVENGDVKGCVSYTSCASGQPVVYCEDPADIYLMNQNNPDANPYWNHTYWDPYRAPVWRWLNALP